MASGNLCLELTDKISWESFPKEAERLLKLFNGKVTSKADAVDIRVWKIIIKGKEFNLTFDDFPVMMSLESCTNDGNLEIEKIKNYLKRK